MPDKQQCDPDACQFIHGVNSSNFHILGRFILNYYSRDDIISFICKYNLVSSKLEELVYCILTYLMLLVIPCDVNILCATATRCHDNRYNIYFSLE